MRKFFAGLLIVVGLPLGFELIDPVPAPTSVEVGLAAVLDREKHPGCAPDPTGISMSCRFVDSAGRKVYSRAY